MKKAEIGRPGKKKHKTAVRPTSDIEEVVA